MGVSLSRSSGRTAEAKYIHSIDTKESNGENDEFLNQRTKGKTSKGRKSASKRTETAFFQFKTTKSNPWDIFDSLDTIVSRKSVPFAALPDDSPQALAGSVVGDEDITGNQSKDGAVTHSTIGDTFLEDFDDRNSTKECAEKMTGAKNGEIIAQRVTPPLKNDETRRNSQKLKSTAHILVPLSRRNCADGRGTKWESVPDQTTEQPHSENEMVYPNNDFRETKRQSVPDLTMIRTGSETGTVCHSDNYHA